MSKNKEELRNKYREYYRKNKEMLKAKHKEYYKKNKERLISQSREYYRQNKEKIRVNRKYVEQNKKRCRGCGRVLRTKISKAKRFCVICSPPEVWGIVGNAKEPKILISVKQG